MKKEVSDSRKYGVFGVCVSIVWILIVVAYLLINKSNPFVLDPNEFGDFWAGALGPLGILWIVLGFWQQGNELRNSVEALKLQSEELQNSVEQQKALVEVTKQRADAEIQALSDERESRRIVNSPKLVLSTGGGSLSRVTMHIRNIGANCSNLNVTAVDGEISENLFNASTIANGESLRFYFNPANSDYLNFHFDIHYLNRLGEAGHQRINASRDNVKTVGFRLVGF